MIFSGSEHYEYAERILAEATGPDDVAVAQVHATLALAAAEMCPPGFRIWLSPNRVHHLVPEVGACATCGRHHPMGETL